LLTLHDALVVGIDDLEINAQFLGRVPGSRGLLDLVVVVVVGQREQERSFFMPVDSPDTTSLLAFLANQPHGAGDYSSRTIRPPRL